MEQTQDARATETNRMIRQRVEADLLPYLGERPINDIPAPELLAAL